MRLALVAALAALAAPASAEAPYFRNADLLAEARLSAIRGGFRIAGFDIRMGVSIESLVDGAPLLSSRFDGAGEPFALSGGDPASTQALHVFREGHLATLVNRADGRVIEQIVTLNIDVLNFRAVTGLEPGRPPLRLADLTQATALGALPR